ncbi:RidA family protein [Teichococcus vastitatis]|uniref:RidA family protein n=1 Tax=Teichococcus vastitatis TaxID=2307076 RepID=A0ABS9W5B5_9PROT|nr:RidA family protein [Pseudoroseomonas vastitatis]MCI0754482.1 RidA family protein [Pseudoroseomonas vastitatis]
MATVSFSNPPGVHVPAARYSQSALVEGAARRLIISGQIGVTPDGTMLEEPAAQIRQALENLGAVLAAHAMRPDQVVKLTVLLTDRAHLPLWRAERDRLFGGHAPCSTLMVVAGLADPRLVAEVEAEAAG